MGAGMITSCEQRRTQTRNPVDTSTAAVPVVINAEVDLNHNGVRDDIDSFIRQKTYYGGRYGHSPSRTTAAAEAFAWELQRVSVDTHATPEVARRRLQRNAQLALCLNLITTRGPTGNLMRDLTAITFDTHARRARAAEYTALAEPHLDAHVTLKVCQNG